MDSVKNRDRLRNVDTLRKGDEAPSLSGLTDGMVSKPHKPKAIVVKQSGVFAYGKTGLVLSDKGADFSSAELSPRDFEDLGAILIGMNERVQLWIGDYLNALEHTYGATYKEFATQYDLSKGTLYNYAYVARSIDFSLRSENLGYSHYQAIAPLEKKTHSYWIELAARGKGELMRGVNGEVVYESDGKTPKRIPLSVAELKRRIADKIDEGTETKPHWHLTNKEARSTVDAALEPLNDSSVMVKPETIRAFRQWARDVEEALRKLRTRQRNKLSG